MIRFDIVSSLFFYRNYENKFYYSYDKNQIQNKYKTIQKREKCNTL